MGRPIERANVEAAWRALAGGSGEGWRSIPVGTVGPVRVLAGRRLPGNEEAVLFGIARYKRPPSDQLPSGRGFEVVRVTLAHEDSDLRWIGVSRQLPGRVDLFAMMIADIIGHLAGLSGEDPEAFGQALLARVRAWQDFMQRGDGVLSREAEVGLVGELCTLLHMAELGVPAPVALDAWQGPLDGLHDFVFHGGVVEVKTSVATTGFMAEVASLEQLDDSRVAPLLVAAVRLAVTGDGQRLPEIVDGVRARVENDPAAGEIIESRLLHAGYSDRFADRYVRRFSHAGTRVFRVDAGFPRLVHGSVPAAVRRARYEIDLDLDGQPFVSLDQALSIVGVI